MNSTQKRNLFETALINNKWKRDKFGHYKKTLPVFDKSTGNKKGEKEYRIKMQQTSYRIESESPNKGSGGPDWIRVNGGYYKDIVITDEFVRATSLKLTR